MSLSPSICRLPAYLLLRPLVAGRRLLHLGGSPAGAALLAEAGARVVGVGTRFVGADARLVGADARLVGADARLAGTDARFVGAGVDAAAEDVCCAAAALPLRTGTIDVVIAPALLDGPSTWGVSLARVGLPVQPPALDGIEACLREVLRVLADDGFACLVVRDPERAVLGEGGAGAPVDYWTLRELLGRVFPQVSLLAQVPLYGFYLSYLDPTFPADELVLRDDLVGEPDAASHFIAVVGNRSLPRLDAYSLVTLPFYGIADADVPAPGDAARERGRALHAELSLSRQRRDSEGHKRELADARRQVDHLHQRVVDAEQAATQVALERDRMLGDREQLDARGQGLEHELEQLGAERRELSVTLERTQRELETRQRQLERQELHLADQQDALSKAQEQLAALLLERDRLRERLLAEEEQRHHDAREKARAEQRVESQQEQLDALRQQLDGVHAAERAHHEQRGDLERMETAYDVLQEELRGLHGERRDLFVALREQREARAAAGVALQKEREHNEQQRGELRRAIVALEAEVEQRINENDRTAASLETLERRLEHTAELHENLIIVEAARDQLGERLARAQQRVGEAETEAERLREQLALAQAYSGQAEQAVAEAQQRQRVGDERALALDEELQATGRALAERERALQQVEAGAARERRDLFVSEQKLTELGARLERLGGEHEREVGAARHELAVADETHQELVSELNSRLEQQAASHELEITVRADELAFALERLEEVEGQVWASSDEASRHAARVAAAAASADNERSRQEAEGRRASLLAARLAESRDVASELATRLGRVEAQQEELLWQRELLGARLVAESATVKADPALDARYEELHWQREQLVGQLWAAKRALESERAVRDAKLEEAHWTRERLVGQLWQSTKRSVAEGEERRALEAQLEELTWQQEGHVANRTQLEEELAVATRRAEDLDARFEKLERGRAEQVDLAPRLAASVAESADLRSQVQELGARVESLGQLLARQEKFLDEAREEAAQLDEERVRAVARVEELTDVLEPLRQRERELGELGSRLTAETRALVTRYEAAEQARIELEQQLGVANTERAAREAARATLEADVATLRAKAGEQTALLAERDVLRQEGVELRRRLERANELLAGQSSTLGQLEQLRVDLKDLRADKAREAKRAERLLDERGELQNLLIEVRRQMAEQRQRDQLEQRRAEQRTNEADAASKRLQRRAALEEEARRQAERELQRVRAVVERLGGEQGGQVALRTIDIDDSLVADEWERELSETTDRLSKIHPRPNATSADTKADRPLDERRDNPAAVEPDNRRPEPGQGATLGPVGSDEADAPEGDTLTTETEPGRAVGAAPAGLPTHSGLPKVGQSSGWLRGVMAKAQRRKQPPTGAAGRGGSESGGDEQ